MISMRYRTGMVVLAGTLALSSPCVAQKPGSAAKPQAPRLRGRCPPIAFVKRHHFKRPFGIGSIIAWDIHVPGCGIYTYDPKRPGGEREIFRRDDGTIFDMSASFDAKKLLFSFRAVKGKQRSRQSGLLSASHVYKGDTLDMVLSPAACNSASQRTGDSPPSSRTSPTRPTRRCSRPLVRAGRRSTPIPEWTCPEPSPNRTPGISESCTADSPGRSLRDPAAERILDDEAGARMLGRSMREPWTL